MARLNRIPEPMPISRGPTDPPNAWRLLDYRWQEALPIPPWLDLTGSAATTATVAIDRVPTMNLRQASQVFGPP